MTRRREPTPGSEIEALLLVLGFECRGGTGSFVRREGGKTMYFARDIISGPTEYWCAWVDTDDGMVAVRRSPTKRIADAARAAQEIRESLTQEETKDVQNP